MRCVEILTHATDPVGACLTRKPVLPTRTSRYRRPAKCRRPTASSLITTPVLTELVRLSLSTSSLAGAKSATAGELSLCVGLSLQTVLKRLQ